MTTYVALMRGINVGGRNMVAMSAVRSLLDGLGLRGGRTLLQSGNAVFQAKGRNAQELESTLEAESERGLGARIEFFVRTAAEWNDVIARNPFPREAEADPSRFVVV